jgi:hypothetical protein
MAIGLSLLSGDKFSYSLSIILWMATLSINFIMRLVLGKFKGI